ncbi:collagen alpha-1(XII) chain-like [Myripristis murdjan]|uniref:collagen alpha-1(XII) chain-like n=1 Tax=Myripristis murdjan TaxID=586833 RepID=UPI001175D32C|nr:collagen alpha-1(XII) chain-like [Myripristis murdjan]
MKSRLSLAAAALLAALLSSQAQTTDAQCKTTAKADIVLLVDGSWSIGRLNFKTIRAFIARIVGVFEIGPDRVQIGLAQYSGDPKTEWHLNAHSTRDSLLEAVVNLPYKGGNTMTGMALNYILQNNFKANVGMRPDSHKIGVLITDGRSQDEIVLSSQRLRDQGIELYAIGVKSADENELRTIATDPDEIHMYNVNDFTVLLDIVDDLTINLCNSVKGPGGELEAPTDLVTSEVRRRSFRITWTAPDGPVDKFRVTYMIAAGGPTRQVLVDRAVNTVVLDNLKPLTEYVVNVFALVGEDSSPPLTGTEITSERQLLRRGEVLSWRTPTSSNCLHSFSGGYNVPLAGTRNMKVYDKTMSTMRVRWEPVGGASGYLMLYKPINASQPQPEKKMRVGADVSDVQLLQLIPNTAYSITLYALHGEDTSAPLEGTGVTLPVRPAGGLRISDVTHSTMKLNWEPAPGNVLKYIIGYTPEDRYGKQVEVNGDVTSLTLSRLISETEYDVTVTPVYAKTAMAGKAFTDVVPAPKNLHFSEVTQTSFRAMWERGARDVALYRIGWTKNGEQNFQYAMLNNDETTLVLENLEPDTLYDVTVTAFYPDESKSEDLIGSQHTLLKNGPSMSFEKKGIFIVLSMILAGMRFSHRAADHPAASSDDTDRSLASNTGGFREPLQNERYSTANITRWGAVT